MNLKIIFEFTEELEVSKSRAQDAQRWILDGSEWVDSEELSEGQRGSG